MYFHLDKIEALAIQYVRAVLPVCAPALARYVHVHYVHVHVHVYPIHVCTRIARCCIGPSYIY